MFRGLGSCRLALCGLLLLLCAVPRGAAAETKEIVAVFTVEAKGLKVDAGLLDRLTDYLAGQIAAADTYQVVPRAQLKQRLTKQRKASYKSCVDQSCQIEIGRELAAQKSLATKIVQLGSRCMVIATLYDLKRAAAERGATAKGGCSEDQLVASLETVVKRLGKRSATTALVAPRITPATPAVVSGSGKVTVDVETEPAGAEVFVDGQSRGRTPLRLALAKGGRFGLSLEHKGYATRQVTLEVTKRQRVRYTLSMTAEGLAIARERTEWFTAEFLGSYSLGSQTSDSGNGGSGGGAGFVLSAPTLKWGSFVWTIFEMGGSITSGGMDLVFFSRAGWQFYLGARGAQQLRFSLGVGPGIVSRYVTYTDGGSTYGSDDSEGGLLLGPALHWIYQTRGRFFIGASVRAFFPIAGGNPASYPLTILGGLILGVASRAD